MDTKTKSNIGGILYLISKASAKGFPFRIRIQKLVLLGKLEFSFPFNFEYSSYLYGPYCPSLQTEIDELINLRFLNEGAREIPGNQYGYFYTITDQGLSLLEKIDLPKSEKNKIDKLWDKYKNSSTGLIVESAKKISGIRSIDE